MHIRIETLIDAPPDVCFDLARNLSAHVASTGQTRERVISGPESGLMDLGDEVTFEAVHFGVRQRLTSKIVQFDRPRSFTDQMLKGAFKSLEHRHIFVAEGDQARMIDEMEVIAPFGLLGRVAEILFLRTYMTRFLSTRAEELKRIAEAR